MFHIFPFSDFQCFRIFKFSVFLTVQILVYTAEDFSMFFVYWTVLFLFFEEINYNREIFSLSFYSGSVVLLIIAFRFVHSRKRNKFAFALLFQAKQSVGFPTGALVKQIIN